jgi:hypothetical protein
LWLSIPSIEWKLMLCGRIQRINETQWFMYG